MYENLFTFIGNRWLAVPIKWHRSIA